MSGYQVWMGTILLSAALCWGACTVADAEAPHLAGRWEGTIDVIGGTPIPFAVTFGTSSDTLTATIDVKQHKGSALGAISLTGRRVHFELPNAKPAVAVFDGTVDGSAITGSFGQGRARGTFRLERAASSELDTARPYRSEDVTFANGAVTLAGTVTIPKGAGPFRAVVLVSGSGAQDRDANLFGFKLFGTIADHLTRQGIAVLRYDDRGVGGSSGQTTTARMADLVGDVLAGVALLTSRPEIERARVGVLGHSEGASVAALAATKSPDVAFLVLMAPPALRGDVLVAGQQAHGARSLGASAEDVAAVEAAFKTVVSAIRSGAAPEVLEDALRKQIAAQYDARAPDARAALGDKKAFVDKILPRAVAQIQSAAMRDLLDFDPKPIFESIGIPTMVLFGGKDVQVPPAVNRPALEAALSGNRRQLAAVITYPEANHLFMAAGSGQPSEYASLPKAFVPGLLDEVTRWVLAH